MSIGNFFYSLIIGPLETLFEIIYALAYSFFGAPGWAILCLSLVMNLLLLPLYTKTDQIQMEAIATEKRMQHWVRHIKKTFKGDERFMMLQTYYRQNNYKPTDALKGVSPLLLEIPFFMAAYHFLSHLQLLEGASFGLIDNLGAQDALISIGGLSINLLPILMTVINLISGAIYTKGAPAKTKAQLYLMAGLFLILLYDSPSGLVLYWTLNNLFSLVKNILMGRKHKKLLTSALFSAGGIALFLFFLLQKNQYTTAALAASALLGLLLQVPLFFCLFCKKPLPFFTRLKQRLSDRKGNPRLFYAGCALLSVLTGLSAPAALLSSSPDEFIIAGVFTNPAIYLLYALLLSIGTFCIWLVVFYRLSGPNARKVMELGALIVSLSALVNTLFFGGHYGTMSSDLIFETPLTVSASDFFLNLAVLAGIAVLCFFLWKKKDRVAQMLCIAGALSLAVLSGVQMIQSEQIILPKMKQMNDVRQEKDNIISLTKSGKNVVVIMLDRAIGAYFPYITEEKPQLKEQFDGFTYYPNTLSFGPYTNMGLPAVLGGYEYTPKEMNKRDEELLEDKHNEALKVLPTLFLQQKYDVTFCDPTYAGYDWIPDLSVFDDMPKMKTYITKGNFVTQKEDLSNLHRSAKLKRNFFYYSLFKAVPTPLQPVFYGNGRYFDLNEKPVEGDFDNPLTGSSFEVSQAQTRPSLLQASGMDALFRDSYNVLQALPEITHVREDGSNTFFFMCNETPHSPAMLQLPDYTMSPIIDNRPFEENPPVRTDGQGHKIRLETDNQLTHYHCNMAAYLQLGAWFDYLRKEGVYDNTRIILVADHGRHIGQFPEMKFGPGTDQDALLFNPILLVKDFNQTGFRTDERLMTNAETPILAMDGLIQNPKNPFTGKPMKSGASPEKTYDVLLSHKWSTYKNNGKTFLPGQWLQVSKDMRDGSNWVMVEEDDAA